MADVLQIVVGDIHTLEGSGSEHWEAWVRYLKERRLVLQADEALPHM